MSVLIKGMEMPKSCEDCPLENCDENYYGDEFNHRCSLIYKGYTSDNRCEKRLDNCPLVPVPPHGRLIDADALMDALPDDFLIPSAAAKVIERTIIPASVTDINVGSNSADREEGE